MATSRYDSPERYVTGGVQIVTESGTLEFDTVKDDTALVDFELLEEIASYSTREARFMLSSGRLDMAALISPEHRKKLKRGQVMLPWLRYGNDPKQYLGRFYVDNVKSSTGQLESFVYGYDIMYSIMNTEQEDLAVGVYPTVKEFLVDLFKACNVTNYSMDPYIDTLPRGSYYLLPGVVGTTLQALMDAFNLAVHSDRNGVVRVRPLQVASSTTVTVFDDDSQIFSADYQKELSFTYAKVACNYYRHSSSAVGPILTLNGFSLETSSDVVKYDKYPVIRGCYAEVKSDYGYNINNFASIIFGRTQCRINAGDYSRFDIVVYGELVETAKGNHVQDVILPDGYEGVGTLTMDSIFIQSSSQARAAAAAKAAALAKGNLTVNLDVRGNPDVALLDRVKLVDPSDKLFGEGWLMSQQYSFNGALSASVKFFMPNGIDDAGV